MIEVKKIRAAVKGEMLAGRNALEPSNAQKAIWGVYRDGVLIARVKGDKWLPLWDVLTADGCGVLYSTKTKQRCIEWAGANL